MPRAAINPQGWTDPAESPDSRVVYVSAAGSDAYSGLAPDRPVRTIAAGRLLLRPGYPDRLLLKRGDTFSENLVGWDTSGRSESEPAMIGAYGEGPRPRIQTNTHGFYAWGDGTLDFLLVRDLDLRCVWDGTREEPVGFNVKKPGRCLTIEGCRFDGFRNSVEIQGVAGTRYDTRIRRNGFTRATRREPNNGSAHVYLGQYDGVLIEENVFDHPRAHEAAGFYLSHHVYLGEGNPSNNVVRGNLAFNGGRTNFNIRTGGLIENNASVRGAQGFTVGISYQTEHPAALLRDNVVVESRNNSTYSADPLLGQKLGYGFSFDHVGDVLGFNNLTCNATDGLDHKALTIASNCRSVRWTRNVCHAWGEPQRYGWDTLHFGGAPVGLVEITRNVWSQPSDSLLVTIETDDAQVPVSVRFAGNAYSSRRPQGEWSGWFRVGRGAFARQLALPDWLAIEPNAIFEAPAFPQPWRTVGAYAATLGLLSTDDLIAAALENDAAHWNPALTAPALNDYLRGGFGMTRSLVADLDGDGQITVLDFNAFLNAFSSGKVWADLDRSGASNVLDFHAMQNAAGDGRTT